MPSKDTNFFFTVIMVLFVLDGVLRVVQQFTGFRVGGESPSRTFLFGLFVGMLYRMYMENSAREKELLEASRARARARALRDRRRNTVYEEDEMEQREDEIMEKSAATSPNNRSLTPAPGMSAVEVVSNASPPRTERTPNHGGRGTPPLVLALETPAVANATAGGGVEMAMVHQEGGKGGNVENNEDKGGRMADEEAYGEQQREREDGVGELFNILETLGSPPRRRRRRRTGPTSSKVHRRR